MGDRNDSGRLSRRSVLRGGLLVGAGAIGGGLVGGVSGHALAGASGPSEGPEAFWGAHQAGIVTATQQHAVLAAFDVAGSRSDLISLLQEWTALGADLVHGRSVSVPQLTSSSDGMYATGGSVSDGGTVFSDEAAFSGEREISLDADVTAASSPNATDADDSLEAYGLGASRLTLTVGFGRSLFVTSAGADRFGLAGRLPAPLIDLPPFAGDRLVAADGGGDLLIQACADNPQVAFHAVRSLARIAPDVATLRWTQTGFSAGSQAGTPRNLLGFKDGTVNSNVHPPDDLDATLWAGKGSPAWMQGGSYLVYRRIRIALDTWDRLAPDAQEQVIGRRKLDGAPLGATGEFDSIDLRARDAKGQLVIPEKAHVRLAAPESNGGAVIVRRAFSYANGTAVTVEDWPPWRQTLEYDAGLLLLTYQQDPRTGFLPIFTRLARTDALSQFTTHTASAVFAVAPGAAHPGDWIGRTLLS